MIDRFVASRRARWERLSSLVDRAASVRRPLSVDDLDDLTRLYRQTAADLAVARRDFPDDRVTLYVNQLVARAYGVIYRVPPEPLSQLRRFYTRDLPRQYRAAWPYLVVSALLLFLPQLAMILAIVIDRETAALVVPPGLLAGIKQGQTWFDASAETRPALASMLMTHNIQVSFLAFAGGILGGFGTIALLVANGIFIGAIEGALIAYGLTDRLVGFVSPHGFLELSFVVVAGACGLMLGRAVVWPGLETRVAALGAAGARSIRLLLGLIPFLVVAGLLEGLVSPADFAWPYKLSIGLTTAIAMYGYLLLAGREKSRQRSPGD